MTARQSTPRNAAESARPFANTRTNFATLLSRATDAFKGGASRDTLAMQVKTDDLGWQFYPQFYGQLYDELKK